MTTNNFLSFDIETHKDIGEFKGNIKQFRPLGISCAAIFSDASGKTFCNDPRSPDKMTVAQVRKMIDYLDFAIDLGYTIVTWNGASFDFDILYEESGFDSRVPRLAEQHIDMMFQFFCLKGYYLGLDAASKGLGLPGKTEGMNGGQVPVLWAGSDEDRQKALAYVGQDARTTFDLAQAIIGAGGIRWTSKAGKPNRCEFSGLVSVKEALEIPEPDTKWMGSDKATRGDLVGWMR